jgi:cysteine desulfurase/selenocysteine lyase
MAAEGALERRSLDVNAVAKARSDFSVLSTTMHGKPLAFLDSGASAQKPRQVIEAMDAVLNGGYSNIHRGLYEISQNLTTSFELVREKVAGFINAVSDKEIVFTRNATEAINLVAQSYGRTHFSEGDEIIITAMEHHANIVPWQLLRDQIGVVIKVIPITERGELDLEAFEGLLSERTKLVALVHVSNVLGTVNPIKQIAAKAKAYNSDIKVLLDGSQAVVHSAVDVQDLDCDFYAFTGHKLYGPTGIGVLYGKYDVLDVMSPYQGGGDMIDHVSFDKTTYKEPPFRFEAGTPAIVEAIGLGAAIDYVSALGLENVAAHEADILAYGTEQLEAIDGLTIHGTAAGKAGIMSFSIAGVHPSDIGMLLDQCGVAVRTGHHCCMPLMEVLGVDATVRASLGLYSNKDDIDRLVAGLRKAQEMLS